jgi:dTDP-4-dehydrorhamnose reductase
MNIFISGASGLVGGNCLNHFSKHAELNVLGSYFSYPTENTVYYNTLDLEDGKNTNLNDFQPDVIVHCGALTHVDYCEDNVDESYQKTVQSTINLIKVCKSTGAKMVFISTDYVFDGKSGPYSENAPVNPLSVYGRHKLEAEQLVEKELGDKSLILRVTNVYGDEVRGKNFVARMLANVNKNAPIAFPLPIDQYATPVNAYDVARAIYLLLSNNKSGLYHIASTDWVNRVQLADMVLKYFDQHQVNITPALTSTINQRAERPLFGGLISKKFSAEFPDFRFTNVDDYVRNHLQQQN